MDVLDILKMIAQDAVSSGEFVTNTDYDETTVCYHDDEYFSLDLKNGGDLEKLSYKKILNLSLVYSENLGDDNPYIKVFKYKEHYIRYLGTYSSWDTTSWYDMKLVQPTEITIIKYLTEEEIKNGKGDDAY